jgi:hypothetical protein
MVICGQGVVRAYPPRVMRSWQHLPDYRRVEIVKWSPDLWLYTRTGWRVVDRSRPWFRAFTTSIGYYQAPYVGAWVNEQTNSGLLFVPYYVRPGYYAIKNYMRWPYARLAHWQFSRYCRVG